MVSVIIPCYNYGRFLADALTSILAQTYTDWECIIVDDGSSDNTREVGEKYAKADPRFIYVFQKNGGVAVARNTALQRAKGNYIQLLDADDMIEPDKLRLQVALFESEKEIDFVYSDIVVFNTDAPVRDYKNFKVGVSAPVDGKGELVLAALLEDNFFLPGCVMFRSTVYEKTGFFQSGIDGMEDWNYWYRIALLGFYFYNDARSGTRLQARDHEANASKVRAKMLLAKINARKNIISTIQQLNTPNTYLGRFAKKHKTYLSGDLGLYELYYGNFLSGVKHTLVHVANSRKPLTALRNGLKWTYLRVKGYKV